MTVPDTPQPHWTVEYHWTVNGGELICDDERDRRSVINVLGNDDVWTEHGEALLALVAGLDALAATLATAREFAERFGGYPATGPWRQLIALLSDIPKPNPTMTRPRCRKCGTPGPHCACGAMDWT